MLLLLCLSQASADPAADHQARFREARDAEADLRFDDAVRACTEAMAIDPDGPRTPTCARRNAALEARRDADGRFGTWTALQDVRQRAQHDDRDGLRDEVRALYAREVTADAVRAELELWLARDALDRLDSPEQALPYTASLAGSVEGLGDERLWREGLGLHAVVLARLGRVEEAQAVEAQIEVPTLAPRPTPVDQVVEARWHRAAAWVSGVVLVGFLLIAGPWAVRGWARPPRPMPTGIVVIGLSTFGAGWLAMSWAEGAAAAVPSMMFAFVVIHGASAGALHATAARPRWRLGVRLMAGLATVAAGYLALFRSGSLGWVGL